MKMKRVLSALLTVLMILPLCLLGVTVAVAEGATVSESDTVKKVLYYNGFEDGETYQSIALTASELGLRPVKTGGQWAAQGATYEYGAYVEPDGTGAALFVSTTGGNSSVEFFSADKMQAANAKEEITSYVMTVDFTVLHWGSGSVTTGSAHAGFQFAYDDGTEESAEYANGSGNAALLAWRTPTAMGIQTYGTHPAGSLWDSTDGLSVSAGVKTKLALEVDVVKGVANFYIYGTLNGTTGYHMTQTVSSSTFNTLGAFAFHNCYTSVLYDNINITRGTLNNRGSEIYSNNYDQLAEGRKLISATKTHNGSALTTLPGTYAGVVTEDSNNVLRFQTPIKTTANWQQGTGVEIVPASAFDGFTGTKYTIELDLKLDKQSSTDNWILIGGASSPRVRVGQYTSEGNSYFLGNDAGVNQWKGLANTNQGKYVRLIIEVDISTGLGSVSIEDTDYVTDNITVPKTLGAITMVVGWLQNASLDNVTVYTDAKQGDVLYEQDFDALNNIEEANFGYSGGGMAKAITSLVTNGPVDGSKAMKVEQNGTKWSYTEIVPAAHISYTDVYTVVLKASIEGTMDRFTLMHNITTPGGGGGTNNGWAAIRRVSNDANVGASAFENYYYATAGQMNPTTTGYSTAWTPDCFEFALTVNKTAGTATLYYNGVEISTLTLGAENLKDSPIALMIEKKTKPTAEFAQYDGCVYVDDIYVTAGNYDQASEHNDPLEGTVLYEENFGNAIGWRETSGNAPAQAYKLSVDTKSGNDKHATYEVLDYKDWTRSYLEVVSSEKMNSVLTQGDTYTISMDVNVVQLKGDHFYIGFGGERVDKHNSYFVYLNTSGIIKIESYLDGAMKDKTSNTSPYTMGEYVNVAIEANTNDGRVRIFLNGQPIVLSAASEGNENGYYYQGSIKTIDNVWVSLGAGSRGAGNPKVQIDNVLITKGAYGTNEATVYSDNFDSYNTITEELPAFKPGSQTTGTFETYGISYQNGGDGAFLHHRDVNPATNDANGNSTYYDRWSEHVIVPAGMTSGVQQYTVSFDLYIPAVIGTSYATTYIRLGSAKSASSNLGAWVNLYYGNDSNCSIKENYDKNGVETPRIGASGEYPFANRNVKVSIEVDMTAKIVKLYLDGELILTSNTLTTLSHGGAILFGSDGRATYYVDNIVITAGSATDAPADYYGAQLGVGKSSDAIRFVGTLGKRYDETTVKELTDIGFHITANYNGVTEIYDDSCYYLFDRLKAYDQFGITHEEYTAAELGGEHIFALTIYGIPESAGTVTFTVTPYFETAKGRAMGTTWIVVYDAASHAIISQTIQ